MIVHLIRVYKHIEAAPLYAVDKEEAWYVFRPERKRAAWFSSLAMAKNTARYFLKHPSVQFIEIVDADTDQVVDVLGSPLVLLAREAE